MMFWIYDTTQETFNDRSFGLTQASISFADASGELKEVITGFGP